jgi:hypothetical protein
MPRAISITGTVTDRRDEQPGALGTLAAYVPPELLPDLLRLTQALSEEFSLPEALRGLAPRLYGELVFDALDIAHKIQDTNQRFLALIYLVPYLPFPQRTDVCNEIRNLVPGISEMGWSETRWYTQRRPWTRAYWQAQALSRLASYLPQTEQANVYAEALSIARTITDERWRAQVIATTALHLSPEQREPMAIKALTTGSEEYQLASILHTLTPLLTGTLLPQATSIVRSTLAKGELARALAVLIPHLPNEQQAETCAEILTLVHSIEDQQQRTFVLGEVVSWLPIEQQAIIWPEIYEAADRLPWLDSRLISHLPLVQQIDLYTKRLSAPGPKNAHVRTNQLFDLVPKLPDILLPRVVEIARLISDVEFRAPVFAALAARMPKMLPEALELARATKKNDAHYDQTLSMLVSYFPATMLSEALEYVRTRKWNSKVLEALVPHVPEENLFEVLELAMDALSEWWQEKVLSALAPRLSIATGITFTTADARKHWQSSVRVLASKGRPDLLGGLNALMPWLIGLKTPHMLEEFVAALDDVAHCWP